MRKMNLINLKKLPNPKSILKKIKSDGFAIYNNVINDKDFKKIRNYWIQKYRKLEINNLEKPIRGMILRLGEKNFDTFVNDSSWCLYRNSDFFWNKPDNILNRSLAIELQQLKNMVAGRDKNFGLGLNSDRIYAYSVVNIYPNQVGFLREHSDYKKSEMILHSFINLTRKYKDFNGGGLYLKKGGKTFELDIGENSIVFFNGQLEHGIEKINSRQNIPRIAIYPIQAYFANQENFPRTLRLLFKSFLKMKRIWSKNDIIKQGLYIDK